MAPWRPVRPRNSGSGGDEPAEEEVDMDQVVAVLKSLEPLCSQQVGVLLTLLVITFCFFGGCLIYLPCCE